WDVIVDVGRAWREGADGGATRIAFPFALQERNANCTHNGLLTFVIDRRGRHRRSRPTPHDRSA
ncbi:MAG: hypothetical protein AAFV51_09795, partial [Pseudomonadota bacterium]